MMLLALGANIGGFSARGLVTAAVELVDGPPALASRFLPISEARAVAPRPIWQRRRKCRRVTSSEYLWCRFMDVAGECGTGFQPVRTVPKVRVFYFRRHSH